MERANYAVFAPRHVQDQAMAQFCTRCGTPLNGSDLFCPTCGTATNGGNNYYGDANTNWQFPPINPMNMRIPRKKTRFRSSPISFCRSAS